MGRLALVEVPSWIRKDGDSYLGEYPKIDDFYEDVIMINPDKIAIISQLKIEGRELSIVGINGSNVLINLSNKMLLEAISKRRVDLYSEIIIGMRN